ncbi:nitrilase and fragile histidine triad fusion protein NitFhit [Anthonomus grandis grandis]|uniref:nitrilase and fragile histidine triad fusion protein NitFhit n=1 Tax=Anthonomus grandis grandis TaxID=2921223 RepID=UPI002165DEE4|nr:nitrilase and fragile histidine triad fusion protein NitFhit [Anthonomus grandis grandis]
MLIQSMKFFLKSSSVLLNIYRMSSKCTVAVCQFTATNNKEENFKVVKSLLKESVEKKAQIVFLPEASDFIAKDKHEFKALAEPLTGPLISSYCSLAKDLNIWISLGGYHEMYDASTIYNSHVVINNQGEIKSVYRKIHLFDVSIPDKNIHLRESDTNRGGNEIVPPVQTPLGLLGLSICYDLRFPEISTLLRKLNADVLTYPSAFTSGTGKAHWEPLLRARAIENQCYVIAAAQYGKHNNKRISYGQAMIVDPWGKIIAECPKYSDDVSTNQSIGVAELDLDIIKRIRTEMPVILHRRNDIYSLNLVNCRQDIDDDKIYEFADKKIPGKTVFYVTKHSFAFTNIRCVVPGHVLVSSLRKAKRLQDLTEEEIADLFQTTVKVSKAVEKMYNAQSSTVCVQDGKFAGQTIPHVHAHILPRKENDFSNNDDIYLHLAKHDTADESKLIRTLAEQIDEASVLRKYFY